MVGTDARIGVMARGVKAATFLLTALFFLYWTTIQEFVSVWSSREAYIHGFIVAPISVYLMVRELRCITVISAPSVADSVVLLLLSFLWLIAVFSGTQVIQLLAFAAILMASIVAIYGRSAIPRLIEPVLLVMLTIPIWDVLTPLLRDLTISVTSAWLNLAGRSAFLEGDLIHVGAGTFRVVGGCAGLHFFVVGLVIAVLFSHLFLANTLAKLKFVLAVIAIVLIDNWIRVFAIILAGDLSDMQHFLVRVDHYVFGWVVFALSLLPIIWIGNRIGQTERESQTIEEQDERAGIQRFEREAADRRKKTAVIALFLMSVALAPVYSFSVAIFTDSLDKPLKTVAYGRESWQRVPLSTDESARRPIYPGVAQEEYVALQSEGRRLLVYRNLYFRQRQGAELIGEGVSEFPTLKILSETVLKTTDGPIRANVSLYELRSREGTYFVGAKAYIIGKRVLADENTARIWLGLAPTIGVFDSGVVIVSMACPDSCIGVRETVKEELYSVLESLVSDTSGQEVGLERH